MEGQGLQSGFRRKLIQCLLSGGPNMNYTHKRSFLPLFPNPLPSEGTGTLSGSNVVNSRISNRTMVTLQKRSFLRLSIPFLWLLILMKSVKFLPCFRSFLWRWVNIGLTLLPYLLLLFIGIESTIKRFFNGKCRSSSGWTNPYGGSTYWWMPAILYRVALTIQKPLPIR